MRSLLLFEGHFASVATYFVQVNYPVLFSLYLQPTENNYYFK